MDFSFPDRADPLISIDLEPLRLDGKPRDDRDAVAIMLCSALRDGKGLHAETILTAVGALIGQAAAVAVAARAEELGLSRDAVFQDAETIGGNRFAFSDAVNRLLFDGVENWVDLWSLLGNFAEALGKPVVDDAPAEWARHFAANLGGEADGEPLLTADQFGSNLSAAEAVVRFWPQVETTLRTGGGDAFDRYARLALVAVALMAQLAEVVPGDAAASHILQAAMAGAKIPVYGDGETLFTIVPPLPRPGEAANLTVISDPHFPYAPTWIDAANERSLVAAVLAGMDGGDAARVDVVHCVALPFWGEDGMLWRAHLTAHTGRTGRIYVLQIGSAAFLLPFSGNDIREIAAAHPPVIGTVEIAAEWFRFCLGFGGPLSGRVRLAETCEQLCLTETPSNAAKVERLLTPLAPERRDDGWRADATILIDDRIAKIELFVSDAGLVIKPVSDPDDLVKVSALADPFAPLIVGPFIPDVFPARTIGIDDLGEPKSEKPSARGPLQIAWNDASPAQRDAFLSFLVENGCPLPEAAFEVRHAALSFYPRLAFCELTDPVAGKRGYVLIDPDGAGEDSWFMLDTTNGSIFAANERYLALDTDNVCRYAAFFFSSVAGPHGTMPLIESFEELAEVPERAAAAVKSLAPVVPPVVTAADADGFSVGGALLFQEAVTRVTIRVAMDGQVMVSGNELVLYLDGWLPGDPS